MLFLAAGGTVGATLVGGGAGLSHLRLVRENGSQLGINSLMLHATVRADSRVIYYGRLSSGIPVSASIDSESVPLGRDDPRSVSLESFLGVGVSGGPEVGAGLDSKVVRWFAAVGPFTNLTYIVPEGAAFGPPPVAPIGPALEGGVSVALGERAELTVDGGTGLGLLVMEIAEDALGPSNVSYAVPFKISVGLNYSVNP